MTRAIVGRLCYGFMHMPITRDILLKNHPLYIKGRMISIGRDVAKEAFIRFYGIFERKRQYNNLVS